MKRKFHLFGAESFSLTEFNVDVDEAVLSDCISGTDGSEYLLRVESGFDEDDAWSSDKNISEIS